MMAAIAAAAIAGLTSIPHCAGMCGPLAACAKRPGRYQVGRGVAYVLAGTLAGAGGEGLLAFVSARWASAIASWLLGIALALLAWRTWRAGTSRPALVRAGLAPRRRSLFDRAYARFAAHPFLLGAWTVLLPCGALASALLIAAGARTAIGGALAMLAFAAISGTGLAIVSVAASHLRSKIGSHPAAAKILATALIAGALLLAIRPIAALRAGETGTSCHAAAIR